MGRGPRKRKTAESATENVVENGAAVKSDVNFLPKKKKKRSAETRNVLQEFEEEQPVSGLTDGARRLAKWSDNSAQLDRWLASRGGSLEEPLVESGGGITRMRDCLPAQIADAVLSILEGLPEEIWELSEQGGEEDAAKHRFWSADVCDVPELAILRSIFWRLLPKFRGEPTLPIFSLGRYGGSDYIGRHDDRAHVPFFGGDQIYSRTVAAIWYLTRDWTEQDGGSLMDLEASGDAQKSLLPIYNSLVAFEVPHMHAVSPVKATRYRYSIFGWWHQQGERYELPRVMGTSGKRKLKKKKQKRSEEAADSVPAATEAGMKMKRKKKRRKKSSTPTQ